MTSRRTWVRADGKRPIRPDGRPASSTDPATWSAYADVQSGAGDGFGIMLGDGLGCWDFDHCFTEGSLSSDVEERLSSIDSPLWIERSISGTGLHVFVKAPEAKGRKRAGVEFYSRSRFIRVTGQRFVFS